MIPWISALIFLLSACPLAASVWHSSDKNGVSRVVEPESDGSVSVSAVFPGAQRISRVPERSSFRHSRERFDSAELAFEVEASGDFSGPVKAWIFVKDKDGLWFQSTEEFHLFPGRARTLRVPLDTPGKGLLPHGHSMAWNGQMAAGIFESGVSLWYEGAGVSKIRVSGPFFQGKRKRPPLDVLDWELPETAERNRMTESRFQLSREYFNPFDPEEIRVDYEVERCTEDGTPLSSVSELIRPGDAGMDEGLFPAFYMQDFTLSRRFTEETLLPEGFPVWAFRMTPRTEGFYRVRLKISDFTEGEKSPEVLTTPWRIVRVLPSDARGAVRISRRNPCSFEFENGEFFFPVSLNIHSNTDRRSEMQFRWGELPDRGLADYEEYISSCGKAGISLLEIWMASWTCALEWDAARSGYSGVGRYNLAHAWKLDRLFEMAREAGIVINLVLAPHGELSYRNDQEWEDNPYNRNGAFAAANGAILDVPEEYWDSPEAAKFTLRRSRYLAARWGADPQLFAWEFWSEVDLVNNARDSYQKGVMQAWHEKTARELHAMDQGGHLMSTHTCGDCGSTKSWREVTMDPAWHTHIVSDAYRNPWIPFTDQLRRHARELGDAGKPYLITEYGGTAFGSQSASIVADIHAGLWGSLFLRQSASPALWWHDFVHLRNMYPHYAGFARFLRGIDLRGPDVLFLDSWMPRFAFPVSLSRRPEAARDPEYLRARSVPARLRTCGPPDFPGRNAVHSLFVAPDRTSVCGWFCYADPMFRYPSDLWSVPLTADAVCRLDIPLEPGLYQVRWFDTVSGEMLHEYLAEMDGLPRYLPLPPFRVDLAMKMKRIGPRTGKEAK